MIKMRSEDWRGAYSDNNSDTESIASERSAAFSGPLGAGGAPLNGKRSSKKSARFSIPPETIINTGGDDSSYVEITLDIRDDSVAVHSVQGANEDPELTLLAKRTLESKSSSFFRNTSSHIRQVSQELKRFASFSRRQSASRQFDRTKSAAAHALKGLRFITTKTGASGNGWSAVEKRFQELTASTPGLLHCSLFGECIGTHACYTYMSCFCHKIISSGLPYQLLSIFARMGQPTNQPTSVVFGSLLTTFGFCFSYLNYSN